MADQRVRVVAAAARTDAADPGSGPRENPERRPPSRPPRPPTAEDRPPLPPAVDKPRSSPMPPILVSLGPPHQTSPPTSIPQGRSGRGVGLPTSGVRVEHGMQVDRSEAGHAGGVGCVDRLDFPEGDLVSAMRNRNGRVIPAAVSARERSNCVTATKFLVHRSPLSTTCLPGTSCSEHYSAFAAYPMERAVCSGSE